MPNTLSLVFTEAGSLGRGDILKFTFLKGCIGCCYIQRTSWGGTREEVELLVFDSPEGGWSSECLPPGSVSKVELSLTQGLGVMEGEEAERTRGFPACVTRRMGSAN